MSSPMPATINVENGSPTVKQRVRRIFNFPYLVTFLFIIKVALILMLSAGAISVSITYSNWGETRYYNFVAITGIVVALIFVLLNFTNVVEKLQKVPWNLIEILFDCLWAVLALVAAAIVTDKARRYENMNTYAAGSFFAFTSVLLYLIDALIRTIKLKRGELGFTIRTTSNIQSTYDASKTTQPTY